MFEEIGKFIDLLIKYGIRYWYISIPILLFLFWFVGKNTGEI